jgi:hypothetical protein
MSAKREEEVAAKIEWEKKEDAIDAIKRVINKEIVQRDHIADQVQSPHTLQEVLQDLTEEENTEEIEREAIAAQDQAAQRMIEEAEAETNQQEPKRSQDLLQSL